MKICIFIFLILTVFMGASVFATENSKEFKVSFSDPKGNQWQRWVIVEQQEGRTVVLVVEDPVKQYSQRQVTQVVVERSVLVNPTQAEIDAKVDYYSKLKDLPARPSQYYKDIQVGGLDKTPKPLWVPVKNTWTADDEKKYTDWYSANASTNMAQGAGLDFDCADFGLLSRWIYAHDNKLPVANTLSGSGKLFGHFSESTKWSNLPTHTDWKKDERFKAAMRYLFVSTYTHSIFADLYPVKVSKDFVTPGSIILTLRTQSGHTQVVHKVGHSDYCGTECIMVLYGNEPARDYSYIAQASLSNHTPQNGGFLRWRWPTLKNGKWQLVSKSSMPGYSLEQYRHADLSYDEFYTYVIESLEFKIAPYKKAQSLARGLSYEIQDRLSVTALGSVFCHYQYCDPQGQLYDEFSTPSKDRRFREKRDHFLRLASALTAEEQRSLQDELNWSVFSHGGPTHADYIFNLNGISDRMSSDPSVTFTQRWGADNLNQYENVGAFTTLLLNILYFRMNEVNNGVSVCGNGALPLSCDPNSPQVKKTLDFKYRFSAAIFGY